MWSSKLASVTIPTSVTVIGITLHLLLYYYTIILTNNIISRCFCIHRFLF
jgi:hypothetical protein